MGLFVISLLQVQGILHILQGTSSALFEWDDLSYRFCAKVGIYVTHLSLTSLHDVLNQFLYDATCLRLIGIVIERIERSGGSFPTLRAFASAASAWLKVIFGFCCYIGVFFFVFL